MAFVITLGFATEQDREAFRERNLPRVRAAEAEQPGEAAPEDGLHRLALAVTSQSAARDLCHQVVAFLAHHKKDRIRAFWTAADGSEQAADFIGDSPRDAETVAVRVGAAARAHLEREKDRAG